MLDSKNINCPLCKSPANKNGTLKGKQRYKCIQCSYQFTNLNKAMKPKRLTEGEEMRILYLFNKVKSCRDIARVTGINRTTVSKVIKDAWKKFEDEAIVQSIADKNRLKFMGIFNNDGIYFTHIKSNSVIIMKDKRVVVFKFI